MLSASQMADSAHLSNMSEHQKGLNSLIGKELFSDVVLMLGPTVKIHGHRAIISLRSARLKSLFSDKPNVNCFDLEKEQVVMKSEEKEFRSLLMYIYADVVDLSVDLIRLLKCAHMLQLHDIIPMIEENIKQSLIVDNCTHLLQAVDALPLPVSSVTSLREFMIQYIAAHCGDIHSSVGLHLCPAAVMLRILQSDALNVPNEECVFEIVVGWCGQHDAPDVFEDLVTCCRFPLLSTTYLMDVVQQHPMVKGSFAARECLLKAFESLAIPERKPTNQVQFTPRCTPASKAAAAAGGGAPHALNEGTPLRPIAVKEKEKEKEKERKTPAPRGLKGNMLKVTDNQDVDPSQRQFDSFASSLLHSSLLTAE